MGNFVDGLLQGAGYSWKWETKLPLFAAEVFLVLSMLLLCFFIQTNFPQDLEAQKLVTIFSSFLLIGLVIHLATKLAVAEHTGFGSGEKSVLALIMGFGVAFFLVFVKLSVAPLAIAGDAVFWTVLVAGIAETYFFQNTLVPTISELTNSTVFGLFWGNLAFGLFHFFVTGGNPFGILTVFLFGLIMSLGNGVLKTTLFSYSLHIGNNAFFLLKQSLGLFA